MSEKTITEAMGIEDGWTDKLTANLQKVSAENETISDFLEEMGRITREEELGDVRIPLSKYEKKLLLAGYFAGHSVGSQKSNPLGFLAEIIGSELRKGKEDGKEG